MLMFSISQGSPPGTLDLGTASTRASLRNSERTRLRPHSVRSLDDSPLPSSPKRPRRLGGTEESTSANSRHFLSYPLNRRRQQAIGTPEKREHGLHAAI